MDVAVECGTVGIGWKRVWYVTRKVRDVDCGADACLTSSCDGRMESNYLMTGCYDGKTLNYNMKEGNKQTSLMHTQHNEYTQSNI